MHACLAEFNELSSVYDTKYWNKTLLAGAQDFFANICPQTNWGESEAKGGLLELSFKSFPFRFANPKVNRKEKKKIQWKTISILRNTQWVFFDTRSLPISIKVVQFCHNLLILSVLYNNLHQFFYHSVMQFISNSIIRLIVFLVRFAIIFF